LNQVYHQHELTIGADARCLNVAHLRGMGKYLWHVIDRTAKEPGVRWHLFADRPDLPMHTPASAQAKADVFEMRGYRFRTWEQIGLPWRAVRTGVHLVHSPGSTMPLCQPVPAVVTIHDTVPWQLADEVASPRWYWKLLLPLAFRRCAAVITISDCSRRDLVRLWPWIEAKLHVVPHGIDRAYLEVEPGTLESELAIYGVRAPYMVYIGGIIPRKRLSWALRVWGHLADARVQLVVCGVDKHCWPEVIAQVAEANRTRLCLLPFVPEEQMPRLYQNAVAVLYPTLYEGFGLPALEAQAVGTPVLFSDVGSLSELKGPAACVLPTDDLEAWVSCCRRLLAERSDCPQPIEAARRWAAQFSWDESARKHLEVYYKVARRRRRRKTPLGNNVA
jgi:alpha-1,3-rhamnosyl/mannosyltransferase